MNVKKFFFLESASLSLTADDFNWAVTLKPKIAMDLSVFVTSTTLKNGCVEEAIDALEEAVDALSIQGDVMETTSYPTVAAEPRETLVTQQMSLRKKDFTNTIRLKYNISYLLLFDSCLSCCFILSKVAFHFYAVEMNL